MSSLTMSSILWFSFLVSWMQKIIALTVSVKSRANTTATIIAVSDALSIALVVAVVVLAATWCVNASVSYT